MGSNGELGESSVGSNGELGESSGESYGRENRRALRVCLILLSDNDLLYTPALLGADFDPTDYGRSPEYFARELALCIHPWLPIAPPATTILGSQYTAEELEAVLLE